MANSNIEVRMQKVEGNGDPRSNIFRGITKTRQIPLFVLCRLIYISRQFHRKTTV